MLAAIGWPVLDRIRFGPFAVSPHGLGIAIGFLLGAVLLTKLAPSRGISSEHISTMIFWALIGAILGSRLFYVIAHFSEFRNVGEMLAIWRGGISLLGGIAGAILVNVPRFRRYGYRFFQVMDPAAIALAMGIAIGRIGDLVIGDHLGKPTSWALAWTYHGGNLAPPYQCNALQKCFADLPDGSRMEIARGGARMFGAATVHPIATGIGVHQTALYDLVSAAALFGVLWFLHKRQLREGVLACVFGLWYGTTRFITDFLRVDKQFFGLTGSQWTAITVAAICAALLIRWATAGGLRTPTSAQRNAAKQDDSGPSGHAPATVGSGGEASVRMRGSGVEASRSAADDSETPGPEAQS
jgi:phosphatidylglycerol---prolipoprotein diacylglyceryl transferase